ncbi:AMMECR1 domain-containing protein [Dichotomopilus funicola]|uniref:AMMECR1 domain-containing protein n=1 Tax=Dichotomopilus funicola TaxID=1934379 RepID=A0AAN6V1F6_9PEZI|nr:AMMECR1 domain-containing protein [Dichotomopilus funicola]
MASVEHCLYCFETLAARLEDRTPLTLSEVQKSWAEYARSSSATEADDTADESDKLAKRLPALTRVTEASSSSSSASSASNSTLSLNPDTPGTSTSSIPAEADNDDDADPALPPPITESPLFVTWNAFSTRHGEYHLRGCIGTFEAQPIEHGLSSYAIISALEDTRFHPISTRELPSLEVAVTLLTDFEDADDEMDWELGTHGLRISFVYHGRRYGATYLPDVATEQGWTKEETLVSLMRKAGWVGKKERWNEVPLNVVRYQGKKKTVEYAEFKKWRDWVDAQ